MVLKSALARSRVALGAAIAGVVVAAGTGVWTYTSGVRAENAAVEREIRAARLRRELEYLLFGLLCFGMAITDAGFTAAAVIHGGGHWATVMKIVHTGAIVSTALNVHFVMQFVAPHSGLKISVSIGGHLCTDELQWPSWYSEADGALYQVKGRGGDGWLCL